MSSETINPGFRGLVKANTLLPGRPPFGAGSFVVVIVKTLNFSTPRPERSIVVALAAWRASYSRGGEETYRLRTLHPPKLFVQNTGNELPSVSRQGASPLRPRRLFVNDDSLQGHVHRPAHTSLARRARQVLRRQARQSLCIQVHASGHVRGHKLSILAQVDSELRGDRGACLLSSSRS